MKIQSISIVVPTKRCINDCPCCISKLHDNEYLDEIDAFKLKQRIKYATMNGVTTCVLTGTGEPLQNKNFLTDIYNVFKKLDHPFPNVELQTTGVKLLTTEEIFNHKVKELIKRCTNIEFLKHLGLTTISLSVFDIFNNNNNLRIIGVPPHLRFDLKELIDVIKDHGINVRLSINMTDIYDHYTPVQIFDRIKELGANQVTFRRLYDEEGDHKIRDWIINHRSETSIEQIKNNIKSCNINYRLPFGAICYSVHGLSTVIDDDCMGKNNNDSLKYVILREDGKLYAHWDDKGSLIF